MRESHRVYGNGEKKVNSAAGKGREARILKRLYWVLAEEFGISAPFGKNGAR